jgi:diguanylate cyclase (GGDEF)-like protein
MTDDRFPAMRELARACDVRSCWSFPVLSPTTGALLGTFALYGRSPGLPDPGTEAIVARASRLVAITLDRQVLLGRLAHQAQHDDLTGLPNRLTLLDRLTTALEQPAASSWPAVIFIDLDRLKVVNDSLGHDVGDELLVIVADRLTGVLPEAATVARFGGDEFVVLTTVPDAYEGAALAERVLTTVAAPVLLAGRTITPSASAGVVLARTGQSATEVLRDADIAMYRAKHDGGSGFALFNDDMRQRAFDRLDLEQQIREGIAAEEFRVYYQPVVDLTAGDALVGFEALVRWEHPTRGTLGPASFIQLAEETGAIVELGDWVLRRTAATVGAWGVREPRRTGTVAVNLAALQLGAPGLVAAVGDAVTTLGAWSLSLELTESSLMGNTIATRGIVDELVALGASLAIDDFGTGFSSLSYLTRLPVHTLKIDRSFVHDLDNPAAMAVAQTVVSLATGLRLDVVAEGIETAAQRSALVSMGCRFGQGFLFGRPLPEDEAFAVLRAAASS